MATFRGKLVLAGVFKKLMPKGGGKKEAMGFELSEDMMQMMGGFTLLRMTSLVSMMNVSFTKEELLAMNKKLNRIRAPKKK